MILSVQDDWLNTSFTQISSEFSEEVVFPLLSKQSISIPRQRRFIGFRSRKNDKCKKKVLDSTVALRMSSTGSITFSKDPLIHNYATYAKISMDRSQNEFILVKKSKRKDFQL